MATYVARRWCCAWLDGVLDADGIWRGCRRVLVLLVWAVTRAAGEQPGLTEGTPEQILKRRYARGELDRDDYEGRLSDLRM